MRVRVFDSVWTFSLVVLLVAFGCVVTPALAAAADDASVRGSVIDPLGAVVVGATVELWRDGSVVTHAVTDAQGRYAFANLAGGWYVLAASAAGFERVQSAPLLLKGGAQAAVPLMLQVGTLRQDIVVTASASSVSAAQVGAPVTVLDRQALERLGSTELLDPLRTVPGVAVVQAGQRGGLTSLFVRGGSSNFNKVLIDGIAANEMGGAIDFANLSTSGIERVEVLRAANSVAYGSDAMTGVVDITTRRGTTRLPEGTLSVDGGNLGTAHTDLSVGGVASAVNYFVAYSRLQSDNNVPNAEYRNHTLSTRVGARVGRHTDVYGTVRWFDASAGSPNATNYYGVADDSTSDATSSFATVTARSQWTDRWQSTVRFGVAGIENRFDNPTPTGTASDSSPFANYLGQTVTITGANGYSVTGRAILDYCCTFPSPYVASTDRRQLFGQTNYQISSSINIAGGVRVEHEHGQTGPAFPGEATRNNYGGFVEGRGAIGSRVFANGGVGFDHNAVFGYAATPRISVAAYLRAPSAATAFGDTKVTFNAGKGIKAPSLDQQLSSVYALLVATNPTAVVVDPIGAERSRTVDVGVEQGLANGRGRVRVAYFDNEFSNLIEYVGKGALAQLGVPAAALSTLQFGAYANAQANSAKGVELSGELVAGPLRVSASYAYLDAIVTASLSNGALFPSVNDKFPGIQIGQYSPLVGNRPFRRPTNSGSFVVGYERHRLALSLAGYIFGKADESTYLTDAFFGASMLLPNQDLAAAYQRFDLHGSYRLHPRVRAYVSAANAFNTSYQAAAGYPALPRNMRGGITVTLGGDR